MSGKLPVRQIRVQAKRRQQRRLFSGFIKELAGYRRGLSVVDDADDLHLFPVDPVREIELIFLSVRPAVCLETDIHVNRRLLGREDQRMHHDGQENFA